MNAYMHGHLKVKQRIKDRRQEILRQLFILKYLYSVALSAKKNKQKQYKNETAFNRILHNIIQAYFGIKMARYKTCWHHYFFLKSFEIQKALYRNYEQRRDVRALSRNAPV